MIKNNLRIALRNFKNQPGYTFLNIFGLTLGITSTLFHPIIYYRRIPV